MSLTPRVRLLKGATLLTPQPGSRGRAALAVLAALLAIALAVPGGAVAHGRHLHHHHPVRPPAKPSGQRAAFGSVTVTPAGAGQRLVTVETTGPPMSIVEVCDLPTGECVSANLVSGTWSARLPAADPDHFSIGLIGLSDGTWVIGNSSSTPPAEVPPLVNIG